jgi:hypothetical protein
LNTFDDDNEVGFFEEPRRRPPRDRGRRRPQRTGPPRSTGRPPGASPVLRLAGLVALGIAVVFGFALWVQSCSGQSKQSYSSYIDAMKPLADDSAKVGQEFATVLTSSGLTMDSFRSDLASWSQREKDDYLKAQRLQPPGPLQSAHAKALDAFELRANAIDGIANSLTLAQNEHVSASVAGTALASDAELLTASDIVWKQLYRLQATAVLAEQGVTGVIVPPSKIVSTPDIVDAHSLATAYQRLGTPTTSGGHVSGIHGSNLVGTNAVESGTSTPLSTSSATTVTCCGNLVLDVVFEDSGNFPEVQVQITVTIKVAGDSVYTQTETVPQIASKERKTVEFPDVNLPPKAFGHSALISVDIKGVRGEARFDNNSASYPVFFQLAPS